MTTVQLLARALEIAIAIVAPPEDAAVSTRAPTQAAVEPSILVIGAPSDDAAVRRVAAELEAIGFAVQIEITTLPARLASPELDTPEAGWRAIVRVDTAAGEARLFVRDDTGRTSARIVERGADEQPVSDVVIAHRTVEVLRASLRALSSPPAQPEPIAPPPAPAPAPTPSAPARHDRLFVTLGAALTGSPGGLSPLGHGSLGLRWQPHPRIGVALRGWIPLHARTLRRDEGRASAWLGRAESWLFVALARASSRWQPELGAGVGAAILGVHGRARAPLRSRSDVIASATFAGGAGLAVWLHPRVRLRADGFVGAALPRPGVRFAGRSIATWGRPFAGGALGVEIGVL